MALAFYLATSTDYRRNSRARMGNGLLGLGAAKSRQQKSLGRRFGAFKEKLYFVGVGNTNYRWGFFQYRRLGLLIENEHCFFMADRMEAA